MSVNTDARVVLITGDDEPTISSEAAKLVARVAGEDPDPFALDVIREREGSTGVELLRQVVRSVLSPSFLPGRKTVWLKDFSGFDKEGNRSAKTPDAVAFHDLADLIAKGIPEDIVLVMNGPRVDSRKALCRACKEAGTVVVCAKPEVRDRDWQASMAELVRAAAADKGVSLPPGVVTHLVDVLGTDTARVDSELEKLICFCGGPDAAITPEAAREVCLGQGEEVAWALTEAFGSRDAREILRVIDVFVSSSKDADRAARGMIGQAANYFRHLLQARIFLAARGLRGARPVKNILETMDAEERARCLADGLEFADFHPFRAFRLAEQALRYSGRELIEALEAFRDAYRKCVSSSIPARVTLEEVALRVAGAGAPAGGRRGGTR